MIKVDDRVFDDLGLGEMAFNQATEDIMASIRLCLEHNLCVAALSLLYAGIDAMAWLNCPKGQQEVTRGDFITWAGQYLLPGPGLACDAEDLYAARCGLLHTQTPDSRLSHSGAARLIFYVWGTQTTQELRWYLDKIGAHDVVAVHVSELIEAFRVGLQAFRQVVRSDPALAERVYSRARRSFTPVTWWQEEAAAI